MENTKTYAFRDENQVGRARSPLRTPLLEGQTPQGNAVLWLCQTDTFVPLDKGGALVVRADARSPWNWLASLDELQAWLETIDREQLGQRLGIWVDRAKWGLFGTPDGKIQEKEVETFESRWKAQASDEMTQFEDKGYRSGDPDHPPQRCILGWWHQKIEVDPHKIALLEAVFPDKRVAVLEEPRRVVQHEVVSALRLEFERGRSALVPVVTESRTHTVNGTTDTGTIQREEFLQRCQREGNPVYVLPLE